MRLAASFCVLALLSVRWSSIQGVTGICKENKYIDYNQMVETNCLIVMCIQASNCSQADRTSCPCKRDFVVRYNVTTAHDDELDHEDDDEEHNDLSATHLTVITQQPDNDNPVILVS